MKKLLLFIPILLLTFPACKESPKQIPTPKTFNGKAQPITGGNHKVIVKEYQDVGSVAYIEVIENGKTYWIAANKIGASKGDTLFFSQSIEMKNFKSTSLNKTFKSILFVNNISSSKKTSDVLEHPKKNPQEITKVIKQRYKGSLTIKQIFSDKKSLSGKTVTIEGEVTKVNPQIMNKNWIHIQDGTSYKDNYDLLITSNSNVKVGSYVIMQGTLSTNKDFSSGYKYPVVVENAKLIKEVK
ncbi:MAG TPA: hypothetical protein ENI57_00250 [Ignavibacteria bacterium]|nr:hypothetical protein [Ignavibacteria bacterium]